MRLKLSSAPLSNFISIFLFFIFYFLFFFESVQFFFFFFFFFAIKKKKIGILGEIWYQKYPVDT